jgi:hypothetical protein
MPDADPVEERGYLLRADVPRVEDEQPGILAHDLDVPAPAAQLALGEPGQVSAVEQNPSRGYADRLVSQGRSSGRGGSAGRSFLSRHPVVSSG